ncbi:hypothetical protein Scep_009977 [Stephania cephalantha]|uniref:Protein FAR1-RELATED SEQUENCE n=1 Tax=Stephania cephalantha TaxID=152367 RepID=A0AAP0JUK7_9MAGN
MCMDRFSVSSWRNHEETMTQRVESVHSTLKQYIGTCTVNFESFWSVIHGMLDIQHNKIKASFDVSLNVVQHGYMDGLYRHLRGYVSQKALKLIRDEVARAEDVGTCPILCGCAIRTNRGLPCTHELNDHILAGSPIPLEDIHIFWKKLSMIPEKSVNRTDYNFNDEIQRVVAKFESCIDEDGRLRVIQQLREISCPSSTARVAPNAKVRTRGRPTLGGYEKNGRKERKKTITQTRGKPRKMTRLRRDILVALSLYSRARRWPVREGRERK